MVREYLKIVEGWMLIAKSLLEFRQITPDFMDKILHVCVHILSSRDDSQYSSLAVITYSKGGNIGWLKSLLELGKIRNRDRLQFIKEKALDIMVLLHTIKGSLQIIAYPMA